MGWSVAILLNSPVGCERNATAELVARRGSAGATAEPQRRETLLAQ